jgi:hypothetical protein
VYAQPAAAAPAAPLASATILAEREAGQGGETSSERQRRALADLSRALTTHDWAAEAALAARPSHERAPARPAARGGPRPRSAAPPAVAPQAAAPPQEAMDPYTTLTAVTSRQDWAKAVCEFFAEVFPSLCLLEIDEREARCVGLRLAGAPPVDGAPQARVPLDEALWMGELRAGGRLEALEDITDPHLEELLDQIGLPGIRISALPVMDGSAISHVLLGQGLGGSELEAASGRLRPYLEAAADALRILQLREQIMRRRPSDLVEVDGSFELPVAEASILAAPEAPPEPQPIASLRQPPRTEVIEGEQKRPIRHLDFSTRSK